MSDERKLPTQSSAGEVQAFLDKLAATPAARPAGGRGRLIFALDATASRKPTWDRACQLQGDMFRETDRLGGLEVQLVYYRGYEECRASSWRGDSASLLRAMTSVTCLAGRTQLAKVLSHAVKEAKKHKVAALVFVGDAMEEDIDRLGGFAGELGLLGVPCFLFHEGDDPVSLDAFRQIARLSGGACCRFDAASARELRDLLSAVAVYAAGGRRALEDFSARRGGVVPLLTQQLGS